MIKIIKNSTGSIVPVNDTGISIPANGQYIIPAQDFNLWAASIDIETLVLAGTLIVNNGTIDYLKIPGIAYLRLEDRTYNTILVCKNPGYGDFATIGAALASISTNSSTNRFVIRVAPGIYAENNPVILKSYVSIFGMDGPITTVITPANSNADLFTATDEVGLSGLTLSGVTGSGKCLINYPGSLANNTSLEMNHIIFGSTDTILKATAGNFITSVKISHCSAGDGLNFDKGFIATKSGSGKAEINISAFHCENTTTMPSYFAYASGTGCSVDCLASELDSGQVLPSTGVAFQVDNGGEIELLSTHIDGFNKGLYTINSGITPELFASGVSMENCVKDIQIDHITTTGYFSGSAEFSKIVNNATNTVSLTYTDPIVGDYNISRTAHMRGFATDISAIVASATTTQLLNTDSHVIVVTGTVFGQIVQLPDATTLRVGHQIEILNETSTLVKTQQYTGSNQISLFSKSSVTYILYDNTTMAGVWYRTIANSNPFQGTSPVVCGYSGNAVATRYLEFISGNASDNCPFVAITPYVLVGLAIGGNGNSTCTVSIFKNGNFITPIATLSTVANNNVYTSSLNVPIVAGDLLTIAVTAGSINKPFVCFYLAGT